jgi:hypothetical protein
MAWLYVTLPIISLISLLFMISKLNRNKDDDGTASLKNTYIFIAMLAGYNILVLIVNLPNYLSTRKKIKNIQERLNKVDNFICSNIYKNPYILKLLILEDDTYALDEKIKNILQDIPTDIKSKDLAKLYYTLHLYTHFHKIGINDDRTKDAISKFKPLSIISGCSFVQYFYRYGTFIENINNSLSQYTPNNIPNKIVTQALTMCYANISQTNILVNSVRIENALSPFNKLFAANAIIQILPLIISYLFIKLPKLRESGRTFVANTLDKLKRKKTDTDGEAQPVEEAAAPAAEDAEDEELTAAPAAAKQAEAAGEAPAPPAEEEVATAEEAAPPEEPAAPVGEAAGLPLSASKCKHERYTDKQLEDKNLCKRKEWIDVQNHIHPDHNRAEGCNEEATKKSQKFNLMCKDVKEEASAKNGEAPVEETATTAPPPPPPAAALSTINTDNLKPIKRYLGKNITIEQQIKAIDNINAALDKVTTAREAFQEASKIKGGSKQKIKYQITGGDEKATKQEIIKNYKNSLENLKTVLKNNTKYLDRSTLKKYEKILKEKQSNYDKVTKSAAGKQYLASSGLGMDFLSGAATLSGWLTILDILN